ncbi:hypothetical protein [Streptosporangium sp. NPDC002524]|uniref:hypothetical protein n=1 Tax=Streptosporangium sp. NPDC002524 TaxID=3154537 RepID=UPI003328287F
MAINNAVIDQDPGTFCLAYTSGGVQVPLPNRIHHVNFTCSVTHNVVLQLDGATITSSYLYSGGATVRDIRLPVPNDGRHHFVKVVDRGVDGTPGAQSASIEVWSDCTGVVSHVVSAVTQNPATNEQYVDVTVSNTGRIQQAYTNRLLLNGVTVGTEIVLNPGQSATRRITIPADSKQHVIKGEVKIGSSFANDPCLWYVIAANAPIPPPPDPSAGATEFKPGETVIIQSATSSSPLATDGSEWVLMEISPRNAGTWKPVGYEGGLLAPQEDGTWSTAIPTTAATYPVGSQWDVRARRFRNYRESTPTLHYFNMVAGTVPDPPTDGGGNPLPTLTAPTITGPTGRDQAGGTWLKIYGTGTPGARLEFSTERVTAWGQTNYVPEPTTVGANGKWETRVFGKKQVDPHDYKVLGYRARIRQNKQFSPWSNRLDVTWRHAWR